MFPDQLTAVVGPLPTKTRFYRIRLRDRQDEVQPVTWIPDVDAEPLDQFRLALENSKYIQIGPALYSCEVVLSIAPVIDHGDEQPDAPAGPDSQSTAQ